MISHALYTPIRSHASCFVRKLLVGSQAVVENRGAIVVVGYGACIHLTIFEQMLKYLLQSDDSLSRNPS